SLIFFASAALVLIKAAQSGVFMSAYGRAMIPWAFGASALALATASAIAVAAAGRLGPVTLATGTLGIASFALLATRAMLALGLPGAPFLTYVVIEASCGVILIQTWSVVSEAVDARSAKRLLPVAGVGASLAWTIFGILIPRLVAHLGAAGLLLIAPLLLGLSVVFVRAVARIDLAGKPARGGKLGLLDGWKSGLSFVRTTPLMRLVQALTVLALLGEQLMDYQLLAAARDKYATEAGIAGFFGWFYGVTSAISLFLLLGVSGRLLSRLGAMLGLVLTPVITVLASLAAVVMPGLGPSAFLRGTDRVLKPALWSSAMEQTQTPLPVVKRAQARALSRGVVAPMFYAISALGLAILPAHFDLRLLSLFVLLLSTAMAAVIVVGVRRRYVQALRTAIDDRRLVLDPDVASTHGQLVPIDVDACEALGRELREHDEARALLAAEILGHAEGPSAARALLLGLEHASAQVRVESAAGLSRVGDARAAEWLSPILLRDPISDVRRAAARALRALRAREARETLESALSDTDRGVRAIARVTLLEWDDPQGVESGTALIPLLDPSDREACEAALTALTIPAMRDPKVLEAVRVVLSAEDRSLRMIALETVTRTRARSLLADVAPLLEDARTAADAVARLARWGDGALETAAESVVHTSNSSQGEKEALSRLLSHADVGVRDRATAALVRAQRRRPLPRAAVEPVLERELGRAYRLAAIASGVRDPSLAVEVELRFRETRHRLLQLLALRESRKLVRIVEVGLRKTSPQADAHVAELLEVALPNEIARRIVPLFERLSPRERAQTGVKLGILLPSEVDEPLGTLATLDDPHLLGACALVHPDRVPSQVRALVPLFERMKFLRSVPLFGELPGEDLRTIAEIVETIELPAGEVVFRKGDTGDDLFVILRGKVAIREGKLDVATFGPREFFGELSVIDHEPRSADAIVVEDAQLLRLGSADLGELMARRPQIQEQFLVVLARRLREVTQRFSLQ
ncbi:MAG: cyclic nucleotide-binding domain-containing protein, partial [Polyangiales bacterium]